MSSEAKAAKNGSMVWGLRQSQQAFKTFRNSCFHFQCCSSLVEKLPEQFGQIVSPQSLVEMCRSGRVNRTAGLLSSL